MTALRALVFDVFGTVVDWRGGILSQARDVETRTGVRADWAAVVDDWRRAYQPSLLEARRAGTWRNLDALHRESLATVLARHDLVLPPPSARHWCSRGGACRPGPTPAPDSTACAGGT